MKLNLVPTHAAKEGRSAAGIILSLLLIIAGLAVVFIFVPRGRADITAADDAITAAKPDYDKAVQASKDADTIIATAKGIILNEKLAEAMQAHSTVYPDLYDTVRRYIPSYYRISRLDAEPTGADACVVTMTGYLKTYQEYADLMLALQRIPGASAVSRSGFQNNDPMVPPLEKGDQTGRPIRPGQPHIPDDRMERLDLQIASAQVDQFTGEGGFGTIRTTDDPEVRGAMPGYSTVVVSVLINKDIQTPDPRATLSTAAGLWGPVTPITPTTTTTSSTSTSTKTAPGTSPTTPKTGPAGKPNPTGGATGGKRGGAATPPANTKPGQTTKPKPGTKGAGD